MRSKRWVPKGSAPRTLALIDGAMDQPVDSCLKELFWLAPNPHVPALVARAQAWKGATSTVPAVGPWLDGWLVHVVHEQNPGWREAFSLMRQRIGDV